jgi:hypothetical protein
MAEQLAYIDTTGDVKIGKEGTAYPITLDTAIAGERNTSSAATSYLAVHEQWSYAVVDLSTDSTVVSAVPSILGAVWVITVLSAHACPIQDDTTEIFSVPASAAVGLFYEFAKGTRCETNLTVDPDNAATGTIVVQYRVI